jgi:hypothetical protein
MAISGKYGQIAIPNIGEREPVFILRAQDLLAGPAIALYQILARSHGSLLAEDLGKEIGRFQRWPGRKKIPD